MSFKLTGWEVECDYKVTNGFQGEIYSSLSIKNPFPNILFPTFLMKGMSLIPSDSIRHSQLNSSTSKQSYGFPKA